MYSAPWVSAHPSWSATSQARRWRTASPSSRIFIARTRASRSRATSGSISPACTASCRAESVCERRSVGASSLCSAGMSVPTLARRRTTPQSTTNLAMAVHATRGPQSLGKPGRELRRVNSCEGSTRAPTRHYSDRPTLAPLPLDARAPHDRLAAVGEANERLALAVVIRRPDDECRLLAADATPPASFLEAAPVADERVVLPLALERGLVRVAREHAQLVRQPEQHVHHRAAHLLVVAAADRVPEQRVAGEHRFVVHDERDHVVRMTGRRDRRDPKTANLYGVAPHGQTELAFAGDVVVVRMRTQDQLRPDAPALAGGAQRLERRAGVDVERRSALLVGDEIRVREPAGIHAPLDEHGGTLPVHLQPGGVDGRPHLTSNDDHQGEDLRNAEPRREPERDARLFVRAPARIAPERHARRRRRRHGEETPAAPDTATGAERRQARHAGASGGRSRS